MLRLKYEIDKRGLTQAEFARQAKISEPALSRILHKKEPAYAKREERIVEALGWSGDPAELFETLEVN